MSWLTDILGHEPDERFKNRFWSKVNKSEEDNCWEWNGSINPKTGYGNFGLKQGKYAGAHRVAYALAGGDCSECVCHHCDNKRCCNPKHLFYGTALDNQRDARGKGRHSRTRLSLEDVKYIRKVRPAVTLETLAKKYGVTIGTIHHAEKGITWKSVV